MKSTVAAAIARALIDLGVDVVTHVPGYGGTETFQAYNELSSKNLKYSFHEEVAYTIAHSASMLGKRSAVFIKTHGLAKAANSITDSMYTSCEAGFVSFIFEDQSGKHSDNILESQPLLTGFSMPFLTSKPENIYDDVIAAYNLAESRKQPVALIVDSLSAQKEIEFSPKENLKKRFPYKRDIYSHVVHPMLSDYQYKLFLTKKFEGDTTIIARPELPLVPDQFPERAKNASKKYMALFDVFKNYRGDVVTGDTSASSSFAFPPYNCIDMITYMGGSIPLAIGAVMSGFKNVWALTGDFGFIAAGHLGLIELLQRELPVKVLIFMNRQAAATGGQPIQKKIMLHLLAPYERYIMHISNPADPFETNEVFKEVSASGDLKIILADYAEHF